MRSCCEALGTALERGRQESRMWGQWAGSLLAPLGQQILKKTKKSLQEMGIPNHLHAS